MQCRSSGGHRIDHHCQLPRGQLQAARQASVGKRAKRRPFAVAGKCGALPCLYPGVAAEFRAENFPGRVNGWARPGSKSRQTTRRPLSAGEFGRSIQNGLKQDQNRPAAMRSGRTSIPTGAVKQKRRTRSPLRNH